MFRKVISSTLCFTMLLGMCAISASATTSRKNIETIEDGYIVEYTDDTGVQHITLHRNEVGIHSLPSNSDVIERTKEELKLLKLSDEIIAGMDTETLLRYATGGDINVTVAYYKTDENGNTSLVSEEEAERAAQKINPLAITDPEEQDTEEDSYMRLWHAAQNMGNGTYKFGTAAVWKLMPTFRFTDSLGSAAMECTVNPDTQTGYYSYELFHSDGSGNLVEHLTNDDTREYFSSGDFQFPTNGPFYGCGVTFDLPDNRLSDVADSYVYSNYQAYVEYEGSVNYPDERTNFNSNATYDHSQIRLDISHSLSIGKRGNIDGTIGLSGIEVKTEPRTVQLLVNYVP